MIPTLIESYALEDTCAHYKDEALNAKLEAAKKYLMENVAPKHLEWNLKWEK